MQSYGSRQLDASLLLLPVVGFLPPDDPRVRGTVAAIERELMVDGLVLRYDTREVDGRAAAGRGRLPRLQLLAGRRLRACSAGYDEARALFERLLALRNDVGLLAEEYDPRAGRQLGNFPQAFSHLALVNTAINLTRLAKPADQRAGRAMPAI